MGVAFQRSGAGILYLWEATESGRSNDLWCDAHGLPLPRTQHTGPGPGWGCARGGSLFFQALSSAG